MNRQELIEIVAAESGQSERVVDKMLTALVNTIQGTVADGDRVAVSWTMRGTQLGALGDRPPTGRSIDVQGMTIYYFVEGRIAGHRQVVDRLAVARQLGLDR